MSLFDFSLRKGTGSFGIGRSLFDFDLFANDLGGSQMSQNILGMQPDYPMTDAMSDIFGNYGTSGDLSLFGDQRGGTPIFSSRFFL